MAKVSIIIRTKNEEFWIGRCLNSIKKQECNFDIEIIIVDNCSTDKTIEKAKTFFPSLKALKIDDYNPSVALNIGIKNSSGDFCVCLSAHCIPESNNWLSELVKPLKDNEICAVYGRQLPLETSSPNDKRDLWLRFGLDDIIQSNDPFLHNANSAFRTKDLLHSPFNEELTNIEDRSWGQIQINKGKKIYYSSSASVYHEHGIHQTGSIERLQGVIGMMDKIHKEDSYLELYYGNPKTFTIPSKVLLILLSSRYGDADINSLKEKHEIIKNNFKGWDIICLPSEKKYIEEVGLMSMISSDIRIKDSTKYGKSLISDISSAVNDLSNLGQFWDIISVFDIREDVPSYDIVKKAEHLLQINHSAWVFAGNKTFVAEHNTDDARHILAESGWQAYFENENLSSIVELVPNKFFLSKASSLREISEPFHNYSVVYLDD